MWRWIIHGNYVGPYHCLVRDSPWKVLKHSRIHRVKMHILGQLGTFGKQRSNASSVLVLADGQTDGQTLPKVYNYYLPATQILNGLEREMSILDACTKYIICLVICLNFENSWSDLHEVSSQYL